MIQLNVYSTELAMLLVTYMDNIIDDVFHRIIEHDFEIAEFTANIKRVKGILESDDTEKFGEENYQIKGQIDIENLSFKYDTSKNDVLRNINISIKPHTQNAIVGLSGVGKTTIFKLLTKELTDYTGKIEFDGIEINKLNKESFRKYAERLKQQIPLLQKDVISCDELVAYIKRTVDNSIGYPAESLRDIVLALFKCGNITEAEQEIANGKRIISQWDDYATQHFGGMIG